ncbi:MAG: hypothetical protein ACK55Z_02590 [bacterium]
MTPHGNLAVSCKHQASSSSTHHCRGPKVRGVSSHVTKPLRASSPV